jgi:hypothetical protein
MREVAAATTVVEVPERAALDADARARRGAGLLLGRPLAEWRDATRRHFALPTDAPIVATGHQAQIWHAGILAKWFVADALARDLDGSAVQIVVDEDVNDPGLVEYPALRSGGEHDEDRLVVATLPIERRRGDVRSGPVALRSPVRVAAIDRAPLPEVAEGLSRIVDALRATEDRPNAALQLAAANDRLLEGLVAPMTTVTGTALLASPIGHALLDAMRADPERCIDAYDDALEADARLATPLARATRELPLWILRAAEERTRFHLAIHDLDAPPGLLAPRAFLLTALARLGLCDAFVHGTGGGRYERVTDAWLANWLGLEPAPIAVATATLRLPLEARLGTGPTTTRADLRRAQWDPAALEGEVQSATKRAHLERIARLPRRSDARRAAYRAMLADLDAERARRRDRLAALEESLARSQARAAAAEIARRRTWPFPLHGRDRLAGLRATVREALAANP